MLIRLLPRGCCRARDVTLEMERQGCWVALTASAHLMFLPVARGPVSRFWAPGFNMGFHGQGPPSRFNGREGGFKACLGAHLHLLFPSVPLSPRPDCRVVVDAGSFSFRFILEVLSCARSRRRLALAAFPPSTLPSVHFHFAFASISIYSPFCYTHPFTRSASCCTSSLPSRQVL